MRGALQPNNEIANQLTVALAAPPSEKGPLLELFVSKMLENENGLSILKRNAQLRAEEIDLLLKNNSTRGFWRIAGSLIVVECKNWSEKIGAREISVLFAKLEVLSPDAKTGILVAPNGITGLGENDARLKIREARQ